MTFAEWKAANPGLTDDQIRQAMQLYGGTTQPTQATGGLSLRRVGSIMREELFAVPGRVAQDAKNAASIASNPSLETVLGASAGPVPAFLSAMTATPGQASNPGNVGALVANAVANRMTGGAAGVVPALTRTTATVAGGAIPDYFIDNDPNAAINGALWRTVFHGGTEASAGVVGMLRRIMGADRLQPADLKRTADALSTSGVTPNPLDADVYGLRSASGLTVPPTAEGIRASGVGKPSVGNPRAASDSLEAVADNKLKTVFDNASRVAGGKITFALPDGSEGNLKQALDAYSNLRAQGTNQAVPKPGAGDSRAMAEGLWDSIVSKLANAKSPELRVLGSRLQGGRIALGEDMSAQRVVADLDTGTNIGGKTLPPGTIEKTGGIDMSVLQKRYLALKEAKLIDPAVQPQLEAALFRGGRQPGQPIVDQPGEFAPGMWSRLSPEGLPTFGFHPLSLLKTHLPRFVGTPENLAPVAPVQGQARSTLSLGAAATANLLKDMQQLLRGAP